MDLKIKLMVVITSVLAILTIAMMSFKPVKVNASVTHIATVGDVKVYEIVGSAHYVLAVNAHGSISISK